MKTQNVKTRLLAFILSTFLISGAFAQANTNKGGHDPAARAKKQTEKMTTELGLTPDQVTKVEAINLKYAQQPKTTGDQAQMKAAHQAKKKEIEAVLTKEQVEKYKALKAQHKQQRGAGHQNGNKK